MAKITVFLEGTVFTECALDTGREYLLGRASTCDIILSHPKVSRQHAKLVFDGRDWHCVALSKYGGLVVNGQPMPEDFTLTSGSQFSILPFDLKLTSEASEAPSLHAETVRVEGPPIAPSTPEGGKQNGAFDHSEKTQTGIVNLRGVLFRLDDQGKSIEEINLSQEALVAGRSKNCSLHLNAIEASRRHFTIEMQGPDFVITDLDSANKTFINSGAIKRQTLQSGDEISVGSERFRFEILTPEFENLPHDVPDVSFPSDIGNLERGPNQPAVIKINPNNQAYPMAYNPADAGRHSTPNSRRKRQRSIQIILLAVISLVIVLQLTGSKKEDPKGNLTSGSTDGAGVKTTDANGAPINNDFDRLTPDQKKSIDETYNLAMSLYTTGKYDLAAIELGKIFQLVTNYKDARNIQAYCQQALDLKKQQDDMQRVKNEQDALKQKVSDILDHCEALLKNKKFDEVEACTAQITDLDPDNERATNLVLTAKQSQAQIDASRAQKIEVQNRKNHAYQTFNKAKKDYQAKRYMASIEEFESVEHTAFVDTEGIKEKAKTGVKSAREQLQKQSETFVTEGKTALDSKDYTTACDKFTQALKIYPSNGDAQEYREKAVRELHLVVKNLYEESVIEEDLGNIESAKKKWHTILKQDLRTDDYYDKAQIKLRKYEK